MPPPTEERNRCHDRHRRAYAAWLERVGAPPDTAAWMAAKVQQDWQAFRDRYLAADDRGEDSEEFGDSTLMSGRYTVHSAADLRLLA